MAVAVIGSGVGLLWNSTGSGGQGSIPQPHQKLTRVDGTEAGGHPIVGAEVIPESVLLRCLAGSAPGDGAIVGVGAVPQDLREGRVHRVGCRLLWNCSTGSAPLQEGGRVAVVSDHDPVAADLSVTVLLRQVVAEIPGTVLIGGGVFPGGGGADHIVAGHRSFALVPIV